MEMHLSNSLTKDFKIIFCLFIIPFIITTTSCRKEVPLGTKITASGIVFDSVKNKVLPFAKLYLFGAHQTFTGIYYSEGPLDSTISDINGKFMISYTADGHYIDYGLELGVLEFGGYVYNNQNNYIIDYTQPLLKFNFSLRISNAVVKGRELNFTKIHIKVLSNPFDTFLVRSRVDWTTILMKGKTIDTTFTVRHLPNAMNIIDYYTQSIRDTVGLASANANANGPRLSVTRSVMDTIYSDLTDTIYINKIIPNSSLMPRR